MIKNLIGTIAYSPELLLLAIVVSFIVKMYLIKLLIKSSFNKSIVTHSWLFLISTLIGTFFGDIAWIIKLSREIKLMHVPYEMLILFIRISWGALLLQYLALSLFLESLVTKRFILYTRHKINMLLSCSIAGYFFYIALFDKELTNLITRSVALQQSLWSPDIPFEIRMMNVVIYFSLFGLMIPSILITFHKSKKVALPTIVRHQLATLLKYLIGSYFMVELLQAANFILSYQESYVYLVVSISTLILSYAIYYSVTSVLGIRFLNTRNHVQSKINTNIIHDFKNVVEQLSHVTSLQEICQITQVFFKDSFDIPFRKAQLYMRTQHVDDDSSLHNVQKVQALVERFISENCPDLCEYIMQDRILIYDEIDFSHFYQPTSERIKLLAFLDNLDADIFLPIYDKKSMIAYIIVDHSPHKQKLYGDIERDEMIIFAEYLSNIINLLQNKNLTTLMLHEKNIKDELYIHRQEIKHYKESIKNFISHNAKNTGIIFYKNRRFIYGNQAARELVPVNLNIHDGHHLTELCQAIVHKVTEYKSPQTMLTTDQKGNKLVFSAMPNIEQNNVILIVHYAEMGDLLVKNIGYLQDPSAWNYLLYLETTKAGLLANQFIPGHGELLLNFKINLLKAALSKKPLLLHAHTDDLTSIVELIHYIRQNDALQIVSIDRQHTAASLAAKLFGVNQTTSTPPQEPALFKKLGEDGTLCINHAHLLPLEIQQLLIEYISFGYYRVYMSEQRIKSNIRLIFATQEPLNQYVQTENFSDTLYKMINETSLEMPSIETLSEHELYELIDGLAAQVIKTTDFKKILFVHEHEKNKIAQSRPQSLRELRTKIELLLVNKSKKNNIFHETAFGPSYHITDPELMDAARMGKQALRDDKIMSFLWNKFQNQNKIAEFLGVNRSSVNRRCKQYNLL